MKNRCYCQRENCHGSYSVNKCLPWLPVNCLLKGCFVNTINREYRTSLRTMQICKLSGTSAIDLATKSINSKLSLKLTYQTTISIAENLETIFPFYTVDDWFLKMHELIVQLLHVYCTYQRYVIDDICRNDNFKPPLLFVFNTSFEIIKFNRYIQTFKNTNCSNKNGTRIIEANISNFLTGVRKIFPERYFYDIREMWEETIGWKLSIQISIFIELNIPKELAYFQFPILITKFKFLCKIRRIYESDNMHALKLKRKLFRRPSSFLLSNCHV